MADSTNKTPSTDSRPHKVSLTTTNSDQRNKTPRVHLVPRSLGTLDTRTKVPLAPRVETVALTGRLRSAIARNSSHAGSSGPVCASSRSRSRESLPSERASEVRVASLCQLGHASPRASAMRASAEADEHHRHSSFSPLRRRVRSSPVGNGQMTSPSVARIRVPLSVYASKLRAWGGSRLDYASIRARVTAWDD